LPVLIQLKASARNTNQNLRPKRISVFRRLPESLHVLACPSKSQAGGRDPAIYVLIKHFFGRFFVPFVHFVPFHG